MLLIRVDVVLLDCWKVLGGYKSGTAIALDFLSEDIDAVLYCEVMTCL